MASDYAAVNRAIWIDDDFLDLTPAGQHLYFVLLTDPELSYCGVGDWEPHKIAGRAHGWTEADVIRAAMEMVSNGRRLVIFDFERREFLIKSYVRYDGVMRHNRICVSMAKAYAKVASRTLRGVVVNELHRLKRDEPDLVAWTKPQVQDVLKRKAIDPYELTDLTQGLEQSLAQSLGQNLGQGLGQPLEQGLGSRTPAPAPAPLHQHHSPGSPYVGNSPEGELETVSPQTVFPRNWQPANRHRAYALENNLDLHHEAQMFREHARANGRTAVDWDAAFMTWLGKARPRTRPGTATGTNRAMTALELAAHYEAQEGEQNRAAITDRQAAR